MAEFITLILIALVIYIVYKSRNKPVNSIKFEDTIDSYSDIKGSRGENRVRQTIGDDIPGQQYSIHNYQVKVDNTSTQIDHIVINQYGVYVIETKNYSGIIHGSDNQQEWTQEFQYFRHYKRRPPRAFYKRYKFYNPVKQNATHIYHLRNILNMGNIPFANYVVFMKGNAYKVESKHIISPSYLINAINTPISNKRLTPVQIDKIYNKLISYINVNHIGKVEHLMDIGDKQNKIDNNICPRCGKHLVLRSGKYDTFYGCIGYPGCKFIKK